MKTNKIILAIATAGLLLAAGMLTSTAATHAGRLDRSSHQMFSEQLHQQLNLLPDQDRQWQALKDFFSLMAERLPAVRCITNSEVCGHER